MKTKPITICTAAALAIGSVMCLTNCKTTETVEESDLASCTTSTAYEEVEAQEPAGGYKIYLDASGSMPGYFSKGLNEYITIVSALSDANDNSKVYFWGEPNKEITDVNSSITNGNYKGISSIFPDIFKQMKQDVVDEDVLTFIVTDGIYSNSSKTTKKREGYTVSDLPLIPNKIKSSLAGDEDIAVAVFRFEIPFNGKYYDIDNKVKPLDVDNRPLYVFAIGTPAAMNDFKNNALKKKEAENFVKRNPESIYLGNIKEVNDKYGFTDISDPDVAFVCDEETSKVTLPNGREDFDVQIEIPEWINEDIIKREGNVTVKNKNGKDFDDVQKRYKDHKVSICTAEDAAIDLGDYTLIYCINTRPAEIWKEYSCDDDRAIRNDSLVDKTFGIEYIIKGFELATKHPDELFNASVDFTRE